MSDCDIVRALSTAMAFSSLDRVRVWSVTPSAGAFGDLTARCAFHPFLLRLSGLTMTDVPFLAMFLLAMLPNLVTDDDFSPGSGTSKNRGARKRNWQSTANRLPKFRRIRETLR